MRFYGNACNLAFRGHDFVAGPNYSGRRGHLRAAEMRRREAKGKGGQEGAECKEGQEG